MTNWKTTLAGIGVLLLSAAGPVLDAYVPLHGLNWTALMTSVAAAVGGVGLLAAKDSSTHSTAEQVDTATKNEGEKK